MQYLGVDFGLKRIGFAVSSGELASPWKIIEVKDIQDLAEKIKKITEDEKMDKVIVGMPEGKIGRMVKKFLNMLKKQGIDAEGYDETLSTKQAAKVMIESGILKKKRRLNDAYSAAIILQNYLDDQKVR